MTHSFPSRHSSDLVFGRRAVHPDASLGRPFDVVVLVKAAVDQMAPGPAAMALLQALEHRPHQPAIRAAGQHTDIDHDQALRHGGDLAVRSEEHTSELQSLMRISYAVFCLKK